MSQNELVMIDLRNKTLGRENLKSLSKIFSKIKSKPCELDISQNCFLNNKSKEEMKEIFSYLKDKSIIRLHLGNLMSGTTGDFYSDVKFTAEDIGEILATIPVSVQYLSFSSFALGLNTVEKLNTILSNIPPTVRHLKLSLNSKDLDLHKILSSLPTNIQTVELGSSIVDDSEKLISLLKDTDRTIFISEVILLNDQKTIVHKILSDNFIGEAEEYEAFRIYLRTLYKYTPVINLGQHHINDKDNNFLLALEIFPYLPNVDRVFKINDYTYSIKKLEIVANLLEDLKKQAPNLDDRLYQIILNKLEEMLDKINVTDKDPFCDCREQYNSIIKIIEPKPISQAMPEVVNRSEDKRQLETKIAKIPYISIFNSRSSKKSIENIEFPDTKKYQQEILNAMDKAIGAISIFYRWFRSTKVDLLSAYRDEFKENPTSENLKRFLEIASIHRYTGWFHQNDSDPASLAVMRDTLQKLLLSENEPETKKFKF